MRVQTAQSTENTDRFHRNWPSIDPWRVVTLKMDVLVPMLVVHAALYEEAPLEVDVPYVFYVH